jgi:uncharacterized flavoprotein (TIGR03862 family)
MAAEVLSEAGLQVDLYDSMPSVGRKFLLAGRGGLNLTHAEAAPQFVERFGTRRAAMAPLLSRFDNDALRAWSHALGVDTFVGSSQRVFPVGMKAAPLLRACLHRLRERGVRFHMRHRWLGWGNGANRSLESDDSHAPTGTLLRFATPHGEIEVGADAVVIALGGGSWARLGSDGAWVPVLRDSGVEVAPLVPANCGFDVAWSDHFRERYAGQPLKSVTARFTDLHGREHERNGEMLVTATGLEGSLIYAWSGMLREAITATGTAHLSLDLAPGRTAQRVIEDVNHPRGARSLSSHLQSRVGLHGVKAGLLRESLGSDGMHAPARLAEAIKALPLTLTGMRPLDEAISSAGGVTFEALDDDLMLRAMPGVFCAGEMLDWEAPTGGYLLTGCFATGKAAGEGAVRWLAGQRS